MQTRWCAAILVVAALTASFALREAPAPPPDSRPWVAATGGYVGSDACRSCHPAEHASWHGSFHRTMTQVATRANLADDFERRELDWFGQPVLLGWRGDRLWTVFERGGARPGTVARPVEQLTGSHHVQVLWYSTGEQRELAPVPLAFVLETKQWIPLTSVFVLPPEYRDPPEPGTWNRSCAMCHTTAPAPRVDVDRTDTHVGELGIACEACHGPGEKHVAANHDPLARYRHRLAGTDRSIVDPAALLPVRSAQVCGHCHSVSILRAAHFDDWREHGSPFRPGRDLQATHLTIGANDADAPELRRELQKNPNFVRSSFWSDGQVRLSGREFSGLRQSPCYTHGDTARQMDCTSCHTMHTADGAVPADWRSKQMRPEHRGNAACTQCHERYADPAGLAAHSHHAPDSAGSLCYDCHMPHTSTGLMKASRSHQITSPSVQAELATGRPNACSQCHLDRTLQWTADALQTNWGIAAPTLDDEQRTVAASVRWLLTGDAGLRLLAAWSYGWEPAQRTAGADWMAPFLGRLLDDPYHVVRFAAARSLRTLPGHADDLAGYDFLGEAAAIAPFAQRVERRWAQQRPAAPRTAVLLDAPGLQRDVFARLYARRDDRKVYIAE